ncbi:rhoptry protein [Reticulomyxa filosa]|uniref:Rhoptry protein n=1 Tax=Reticulomyxa filosa TaxID=46433 RepID=X6NRA5_RETFI|nr:rhoptry protein [Reticulomyxa filosa]|eukprot:ETO28835.1 rhoptry protein [Reticulomyxa filosa]
MTASLSILCFDDNIWPSTMNSWIGINGDKSNIVWSNTIGSYLSLMFGIVWFVLILCASIRALFHVIYRRIELPDCFGFRMFVLKLSMWGILNSYGLFARMTMFRHELIIQGTTDDPSVASHLFFYITYVCVYVYVYVCVCVILTALLTSHPKKRNLPIHKLSRKKKSLTMKLLKTGQRNCIAFGKHMNSNTNQGTLTVDHPLLFCTCLDLTGIFYFYFFFWICSKTSFYKNNQTKITLFLFLFVCLCIGLIGKRRLWFLPLRPFSRENNEWFLRFLKELVKNNGHVTKLLAHNPFGKQVGTPIKAVRVLKYEYRFPGDEEDDPYGAVALGVNTTWEYGKWWSRRNLKEEFVDMVKIEEIEKIH